MNDPKDSERIRRAVALTKAKLPDYWAGIFNRTGRGSEWSLNTEEWVTKMLVEHSYPFDPEPGLGQPGCAYYRVQGPLDRHQQPPIIGCEKIQEVYEGDQNLFIRKGAHGLELCMIRPREENTVTTGILILGPDDEAGGEIVFTAYPGRLTKAIPQELLEEIWRLRPEGAAEMPVAVEDTIRLAGYTAKLVPVDERTWANIRRIPPPENVAVVDCVSVIIRFNYREAHVTGQIADLPKRMVRPLIEWLEKAFKGRAIGEHEVYAIRDGNEPVWFVEFSGDQAYFAHSMSTECMKRRLRYHAKMSALHAQIPGLGADDPDEANERAETSCERCEGRCKD